MGITQILLLILINDMFYEKNSNNNQSENETDITDISGTGLVPTHM